MENVFNHFDETAGEAAAPVQTPATSNKNAEKKAKIDAMRHALKDTIATDPEFNEKLRTLSNSLEVTNSLGYGEGGNIVVDKTAKSDGRALAATSAIVGYRIKNIGKTPVKYKTEVFAAGPDGKFVGTKTEKTLAPGASADLTRQYMTMLCAIPEISFQLANGKIVKGSGARGNKSMKAELESFYFSFTNVEGAPKKQVNDDKVKINVGHKVDGKWVVKNEFVESFGYLNNPKEGGKGGRKPSGEKYNLQDLAANYVQQMIEDAGL